MYCPCTYNSSWYHFVPITCMSVKGFSISYNVVNFFFKSRYFYMCIFSSKTISWLPFLWRLSRFVSQFVFCLSVKYLKSVPIAGQCQKLFGPWLIWPKINRVLYFYLTLCIKFIVNLAQYFFLYRYSSDNTFSNTIFHPGATGAAVIGSVAAPFDPPFFKFRAPCGHDRKPRADHSELPTLHLRKNGEGWVKPVELFAR